MKQYRISFCVRIFLKVLIVLSLVAVAGCVNSSAKSGPALTISNAFPPATPLVCPNDNNNGQSTFVKQDKTQFVYKNSPLKFYGYTFYPTAIGGSSAWRKSSFTHYIDHVLNLGTQAGQNLVRPTDFWNQNYVDNRQKDVTIWKNMDYLVCMAKQRGIFVEMDVSAFSWFLISQKQDQFNAGYWKAFLEAVAKHYRNQSSIAFYSILGEPTVPKTSAEMNKLVNFYRAVTDDLHAADGNHLIMAGGFNHMEDESPAIPWWQNIYALPNNNIVGFKTYSQDDLNLMPRIANYARQLGKPMVDEEFGMPQNQGDETATGLTYNGLQISRSEFYGEVYTIGKTNGVVGFIFWNLGCKIGETDYEVSPDTPSVWHVVQQYAPEKPAVSQAQQACPL